MLPHADFSQNTFPYIQTLEPSQGSIPFQQ